MLLLSKLNKHPFLTKQKKILFLKLNLMKTAWENPPCTARGNRSFSQARQQSLLLFLGVSPVVVFSVMHHPAVRWWSDRWQIAAGTEVFSICTWFVGFSFEEAALSNLSPVLTELRSYLRFTTFLIPSWWQLGWDFILVPETFNG